MKRDLYPKSALYELSDTVTSCEGQQGPVPQVDRIEQKKREEEVHRVGESQTGIVVRLACLFIHAIFCRSLVYGLQHIHSFSTIVPIKRTVPRLCIMA